MNKRKPHGTRAGTRPRRTTRLAATAVADMLKTHAALLEQLREMTARLEREQALQVHRTAQLQHEVDQLKHEKR